MTSFVLYLSGALFGVCVSSILLYSYIKRKTYEAFEKGYEFGYKVGILKGANNEQAD